MKITIVGTGYVGLVTGACFAYTGNEVCCLDIDSSKIDKLNKGEIPIYEDKLDYFISKASSDSNLTFTSNSEKAIKNSDIIFLAVSTPMKSDGSSNLDYIIKAAEDIGSFIQDYKIIVVKSTVPVGTTKIIKSTIENKIHDRGLKIKFDIANNPEFLKEGKAVDDFMSPDRIIIGLENIELKSIFKDLYRPFSMNHEKLIFLDINSSELTKYAANAMLAMKISFINEISQLCEMNGADINQVRKGIGSDSRIGYSFIYPSIGFGGSCFPKDVNSLKFQFEKYGLKSLISNATLDINEIQGQNFVNRILNYFKGKDNITLCVWGVTFKPGTDDIRESQAVKIINSLISKGYKIKLSDPKGLENAKKYFNGNESIELYNDKYKALNDVDALLILTEWGEYRSPNFKEIKNSMKAPLIFDGRNIFNLTAMKSNGFEYFQIGVSGGDIK